MSIRYVRVFFKGSVRAERGIYLRVTEESPFSLRGYEVNKSGDEIQPAGYERRLRIIAKSAIISVRECQMNPTYAELEEMNT